MAVRENAAVSAHLPESTRRGAQAGPEARTEEIRVAHGSKAPGVRAIETVVELDGIDREGWILCLPP